MKRLRYIWAAFGLCLAVVLVAMAWISLTALRLERVEAQANRRAAAEERTRLALWRMESALTPLVTRESARPYFTYTAFHPVNRAYTRMFAEIRPDEILVPSPLLTYRSPNILLHFQFGPSGKLTSPQVPTGNQRDLAETGYASHEQIEAAAERLAKLSAILSRAELVAMLPEVEAVPPLIAAVRLPKALPRADARGRLAQQQVLNALEWQMRTYAQNAARAPGAPSRRVDGGAQTRSQVYEGPVQAVWSGEALVLGRRVRVGQKEYVQGCWLDWARVRTWLLAAAEDLLPGADLAASGGASGNGQTYMLAALPVRLLPGAVPEDGLPAYSSPLRMSLLIAWACVLVGAAAVALLLRGAVTLSERRGAFVSAVTHELRTPLTTFRLYAEMLAEGMVADENKRADYLRRLREQADRLSHLVENVLAYARLARGRSDSRLQTLTLGELIGRMSERLAGRARQANMKLLLEDAEAAPEFRVRADASAVEQILLNLVDNACKYAARAADRTIHLQLDREGRSALIRVRDHGPGISTGEAKGLFRPFRKSAREAAGSAPGVGLGLALSRRLARQMGGSLRLDERVTDGACFVLSLPVAGD